ncbi:hypothetical protein L226DRAFT_534031 [Lentinus tigrinus ALCF2SS1-7]|uniref:uncharacterized protein n=1 Tax=Lentinus tigrinus ALCF2SS1-7 TaxID=1328758 RepID=UPI001165F9D7|nr:hypothetical protein L226DRAFT_534031 [Lentinus tigrinus ALCF2SS1-7]
MTRCPPRPLALVVGPPALVALPARSRTCLLAACPLSYLPACCPPVVLARSLPACCPCPPSPARSCRASSIRSCPPP